VQGNSNNAEQHRVRRFATPYGPPYTPASADAQRGLVGWFMGANLTDQFEFLMNTWISTGGFRPGNDASPNASGVDPLFGPQKEDVAQGDFEFDYLGSSGTYQSLPGLQRFIRTDGGLYAFLPSLTALRTLSAPQEGK
jgi:deferrochelatase/peroxidase EfeB